MDADGAQEQKVTSPSDLDRGHLNGESSHRDGVWGANLGTGSMSSNNGIGLDGMSTGFPAMNFGANGDFGQMMQFMPNGVQAGNIDAFPNMMSEYP